MRRHMRPFLGASGKFVNQTGGRVSERNCFCLYMHTSKFIDHAAIGTGERACGKFTC